MRRHQLNRRAIALVLLGALALVGCETLGLQRSTLAIPRDETMELIGAARVLVQVGEYLIEPRCAAKQLDDALCRLGAKVRAEARAVDALIREAKLRGQDPSVQDVRAFFNLALQLAGVAGIGVPINLGGLQKPGP